MTEITEFSRETNAQIELSVYASCKVLFKGRSLDIVNFVNELYTDCNKRTVQEICGDVTQKTTKP